MKCLLLIFVIIKTLSPFAQKVQNSEKPNMDSLIAIELKNNKERQQQSIGKYYPGFSIKTGNELLSNKTLSGKVVFINLWFASWFKQKAGARKKSADRTAVGKELQRIESTRDSFYKTVLTDQQYGLYLKKKRSLVNSK
jgi:hypothetical protein